MLPDISAQLAEAASLMLAGMVVVFAFLSILIGAVKTLSWVCATYLPESDTLKAPPAGSSSPAITADTGIPPEHIAAITAAFVEYKK